MQKVVLPPKLTVGDVGPNVKGKSRKMLAFVRKSAGYTTTTLKVIKIIADKDRPDEADIDMIYTCVLVLHRNFLSEQTNTVFEGSGVPQETLMLYKFLSKNSTISLDETMALENATRLSTAINMAKAQGTSDQNYRRGGNRNRFGNNSRGRGNYYRGGASKDSTPTGAKDYFDSALSSAASGKP